MKVFGTHIVDEVCQVERRGFTCLNVEALRGSCGVIIRIVEDQSICSGLCRRGLVLVQVHNDIVPCQHPIVSQFPRQPQLREWTHQMYRLPSAIHSATNTCPPDPQ